MCTLTGARLGGEIDIRGGGRERERGGVGPATTMMMNNEMWGERRPRSYLADGLGEITITCMEKRRISVDRKWQS